MADDLQVAIDAAKRRLTELLKKVPASVCRGSYQDSVSYKKLAVEANKALQQRSVKYATLQGLVQRLTAYE